MALEYLEVLDSVVNILTAHNTTTASPYLSQSMTGAVVDIQDNDLETIGLGVLKLPAVFVRILEKEDDFSGLGPTGIGGLQRREADVTIECIGIVRKDGILSQDKKLKRQAYLLARNIEGVMTAAANMTLSGTALWVSPFSTEFSKPVELDTKSGSWLKGCRVRLKSHHLYR